MLTGEIRSQIDRIWGCILVGWDFVILQWVRATTADNFPIDKLKRAICAPAAAGGSSRRDCGGAGPGGGVAGQASYCPRPTRLPRPIPLPRPLRRRPATNPKGWRVQAVSDYVAAFRGGKSIESESGEDIVTRNPGTESERRDRDEIPASRERTSARQLRASKGTFRAGLVTCCSAVRNTTNLLVQLPTLRTLPRMCSCLTNFGALCGGSPRLSNPCSCGPLFQTTSSALRNRTPCNWNERALMKNISQEKVLGIRTIVPPIELQREFVFVFERWRS